MGTLHFNTNLVSRYFDTISVILVQEYNNVFNIYKIALKA